MTGHNSALLSLVEACLRLVDIVRVPGSWYGCGPRVMQIAVLWDGGSGFMIRIGGRFYSLLLAFTRPESPGWPPFPMADDVAGKSQSPGVRPVSRARRTACSIVANSNFKGRNRGTTTRPLPCM